MTPLDDSRMMAALKPRMVSFCVSHAASAASGDRRHEARERAQRATDARIDRERTLVFQAVARMGEATCAELCVELKMPKGRLITRLNELIRQGLIRFSDRPVYSVAP